MSQTRWVNLVAGMATTLGAIGSVNADAGQAWTGSSDEVRALVAEMNADAAGRSSLLQSSGAGHDGKKFFIAGDGFRLNVGGQVQFRYQMTFRDDGDGDDDGIFENDFESGFTTRRTKLEFNGYIFEPSLFYSLTGAFDRQGGDFELEDAFVGYNFNNGFRVRWGQFKLPFMREELVSSKYQLAADRSLFNEVFNQDRSQGVEVAYETENWNVQVAFSDGFRSANTDYVAPRTVNPANFLVSGGEADWAFTGRFEYLFSGSWDQFKDFTSPSGSEFAAMVGFAAHYEGGDADRTAFGATYDYFAWTGDISIEGDGWNIFAAGVGSYSDDAVGASADDYGFVLQGGIMIPDTKWEIFARYDALIPDDGERGLTGNDDWFNTVTAGVNYYWHGHAAKWTMDVVYYIDSINALSSPNTGVNYLADDDDGEVSLRVQFQLLF